MIKAQKKFTPLYSAECRVIVIEVSYSVSFERHDVSRDFIKKFPFIFKQYLYMSVHRQAARILVCTGKQKNQMYFYK